MLSYSSNCSIFRPFRAKKFETKKYYEENKGNFKNGKVRFHLNIDVRK